MKERSPLQFPEDARQHAALAERLAVGLTLDMLKSVPEFDHAIRSCLIIVGEATRLMPEALKQLHPETPWPAIWGLRNRLVHAYWRVDHRTIALIVRDDIPPLVAALDRLIGDLEGRAS